MPVTFASKESNLPNEVRYDGPQNAGTKTVLCFTDMMTGLGFSVRPEEATPARLMREVANRRQNFRAPQDVRFAPGGERR